MDEEQKDLDSGSHEKNVKFLAYVLGASLLLGALIISASLFYNFKILTDKIGSNSAAITAPTPVAAAPSPTPAAPTGPVNIALKPNVPFLGSANAKVTVVEYADYQCPFCEKWYTSVMPDLKSKYIDTGKIKFIYQDFAFLGADSNTAAE